MTTIPCPACSGDGRIADKTGSGQRFWSYTQPTETKMRAVVAYVSGGRKPTSHMIALAEWDVGKPTWVVVRALGLTSETWRRFNGPEEIDPWAQSHGLTYVVGGGRPLRTVAQWASDEAAVTP